VITSRAGAFPELVQDGETGLLVETGSVDEISLAITKFCADNHPGSVMSAKCYLEAEKYTAEKFFDSYLGIYEGKKS
jgi:glycosyltransferase involved in cell wall biosynthesis